MNIEASTPEAAASVPLPRVRAGSYNLIVAAAFVAALGIFGGASRADELQQFIIRAAAIAAIAAALWPLNFGEFRDARGAAVAVALVYILVLAQLVPLPPSVWARMPGHDVYAAVAVQSDAVRWRPWTISPDLTLNALAALLPATAAGLLCLGLKFGQRLLVARLIVALAAVSALLGLIQLIMGESYLQLFRTSSEASAVGLFANRNHQAVFLACSLAIGAAVAAIRAHEGRSSKQILALEFGIGMLLLMGLGATGSRMGLFLGFVACAAGAIIFMVNSGGWFTEFSLLSRRERVAGAAAAAVSLAAVSLIVWRGGAICRLAGESVDHIRVAALKPMLAAVRAFFPFGSGFGTFDPVYRRFEPDSLLSTIYLNEAHNEPLQLLIEGGLGALLLLTAFLAWWAFAAVRAVRPRRAASRRAMGMAMATTTLILMLSSLVDYPLRTPLLSSLFAIACVELIKSRRRSIPPSTT
jgi:O-antigen ligase